MEERIDEMEIVERTENEELDDYEIEDCSETSDEAEIDLAKILKWVGIGVVAAGAVAFSKRERIKEAKRKAEEKRMRKLATKLGYGIVDPDDCIEDDDRNVDDDCESNEE